MDKTGVALFGFGHWGRNLARNFAQLGALRVVSDPDPRALEAAGKAYPDARLTADWRESIADPAVQACAIAAPAAMHYDLARRALEAGKDVFVEKPLALTAKEGEALVELAEKQGRILMVGHLLEYHPATEALRVLVAKGELGKIQYVYSNRLNLGRIRTEENALWSFAPHDVHVFLRLLGEAPVEVACQGGSYLSHQLADVTMSMMTFASGVRGHIFVSWLHPFKEQKLVVIGSKKMAVFDDVVKDGKLKIFDKGIDWKDGQPVIRQTAESTLFFPEMEPLREELAHFVDCVRTRKTPRTDGVNGVRVLRVLDACQRSIESGGQPVRL